LFDCFATVLFSHSQIFKDQGKHEAMICDRCLKELNAAFEFIERSRTAEKLYFAKLRDESKQQKPEETEEPEADAEEVGAEHEEQKIKREPSIDIEDLETYHFGNGEVSDESEANEACSFEDDEMDAKADGKEKSPQMFAVQATAKSSVSSKKVSVSTNKKTASLAQQNPFQCPICFKTFSRKDNLQRHVESVHEKKTRFICCHCPKAFYKKQNLQEHITQCHTFTNDNTTNSNRPFECDIDNCGKFYKTKGDLRKHQRFTHSGELSLC
jgi:C2H2-type zinc finger/Zinc finger, C2H2 type